MLTITVSHLREGTYPPQRYSRSNLATVTEHWIRHGDFLTVVTIVNDPALPDRAIHPHDRLRTRSAPERPSVSLRDGH